MTDLRLVVPACAAWIFAAVIIGAPAAAAPAAAALWVGGAVLLACAVWAASHPRKPRKPRKPRNRRDWLGVAAVAAMAAALVCTVIAVQAPGRQPELLREAAVAGRHVTLTVVTSQTVQPASAIPGVDRPFTATAVSWRTGQEGATGAVPVLVFDAGGTERLGIGTRLTIAGTLSAVGPEGDVAFLVFATSAPTIVTTPPWYLEWANTTRLRFSEAASGLPGSGGDLLPGLAIGDTAAVDDGLDDAMKASSLSHLTAVSGANCAIVVGLILVVGRAAGLRRGWRIGASVAVLIAFVVLVTPEPSVMRAAVMATIVLLALAGGRAVRGLPVLALAALLLLTADPWLSRNYGFILSVLATGGLLLLAGPIARLLNRVLPLPLAAALAVPIAAQVACQPVLLLLNPAIPTYGVIANVLAEPAAPLATVVGLLACIALSIAPPIGTLLVHVAWLPSAWIAAVAEFFAALPVGAIPWPPGIGGVLLLTTVTVASLAALFSERPRVRRAAGVVATLLLVVVGGATAGIAITRELSRPGDWQLAVCDVGQGDATLVQSGGRIALIDTGRDPELMRTCLETLAITRIDLLVITHYDLDHVGGAPAVLGMADRVLVGPPSDPGDERLAADFASHGAVVEHASRGLTGILGELRWRILWPRSRLGSIEPGNDASIAMTFMPVGECATGCLSSLFLADLGERMQNQVIAAGPVPRVDVVKVAHHGSADQSDDLYERVDATVGMIGVGADNGYGHPTERLLDILEQAGTFAARTDRMGLVLLTPGDLPGTVSVWTERTGDGVPG